MRHRIDLWLKLVCLFKQRSDAADACRSGHVRLNGERAKASSEIREGDLIEITGERYRRYVVLGLPEHSVAKEAARTMYRDESPEREKPNRPTVERERGAGRPTKRERRELDRLRGKI